MTATTSGPNAYEAWRAASSVLVATAGGAVPCLVTTIDDASIEQCAWFSGYDGKTPKGADKLNTVVEVLAPAVLMDQTLTRQLRYEKAWEKFDRLRRRGVRLSGWKDTYFERLTRAEPNRLESLIDALIRWGIDPAAALYAHIDGGAKQSLRTRGSPCLQYIQLGVVDGALTLSAVYRAHDFEAKALGNFIGLARLLRFVGLETKRPIGAVRCISLHAYCSSKAALTGLSS